MIDKNEDLVSMEQLASMLENEFGLWAEVCDTMDTEFAKGRGLIARIAFNYLNSVRKQINSIEVGNFLEVDLMGNTTGEFVRAIKYTMDSKNKYQTTRDKEKLFVMRTK